MYLLSYSETCGSVPYIRHSLHTVNNDIPTKGTSVKYECQIGSTMNGNDTLFCEHKPPIKRLQWVGDRPHCTNQSNGKMMRQQ